MSSSWQSAKDEKVDGEWIGRETKGKDTRQGALSSYIYDYDDDYDIRWQMMADDDDEDG